MLSTVETHQLYTDGLDDLALELQLYHVVSMTCWKVNTFPDTAYL